MRIENKLCKVKILQLQSIFNEMTCLDKRFAVKNSGISCLALSNPRTSIQHEKSRLKVANCDESYTVFLDKKI